MRFYLYILLMLLPLNVRGHAAAQGASNEGPDFNGDGLSDVTAFENQYDGSPNELAITWVSSIDSSINRVEFGKSVQTSVPSDYDGDGVTDFAIVGLNDLGSFLWQIKLSSEDGNEAQDIFGVKDDLVFYGCSFDADLKADRAVVSPNGLFTYKKSTDASTFSFDTSSGLDRFLCVDLDGDGIDEIVGQKTVKFSSASKNKSKRRKKKKPVKKPALGQDKSYFYVWNLAGVKILDTQFGSGVKGLIAADTNGDGIKEFGYQKEKSNSKKELVFYNAGAEKIFTVPQYLDVSFHNFTNSSGVPDGFVLKAKADNIFLKFNSLSETANYTEIFIPRADTVISNRGVSTVGPVVSKETQCNVHYEPNDGNEGFLWKPVSDTTGNVAVHLPRGVRLKNVRIIKENTIIESLFYGGNGNGSRDLWRSRQRATTFEENITVIGSKAGVNYCWLITDPLKRFD